MASRIVAAMAAVRRYDVQSGAYQKCIGDYLTTVKAGKSGKLADMALIAIENHRVAASVNDMKKFAALTRNAITAFNEYGSQCDE